MAKMESCIICGAEEAELKNEIILKDPTTGRTRKEWKEIEGVNKILICDTCAGRKRKNPKKAVTAWG